MTFVSDSRKSREQLLAELQELRARLALLTRIDPLESIYSHDPQLGRRSVMHDTADVAVERTIDRSSHPYTADSPRHPQMLEGLREILSIMNSTSSLDDTLQQLIALVSRLLDADAGVIYRL